MGRVVHFELPADDPERAINFYQKALGWTFKKWEGPVEYWLVMTGPDDEPGIDGGLAPRGELEMGAVNTVDVASVDEVTARVEEHGGKVVHPKHPVPGVGWLAYCEDTEGTVFGVMERDPDAG